jgi:hypothetical protein
MRHLPVRGGSSLNVHGDRDEDLAHSLQPAKDANGLLALLDLVLKTPDRLGNRTLHQRRV